MCTSQCVDPNHCSSSSVPCGRKAILSEADVLSLENCTEVCGLYLENMPNFDVRVFRALSKLKYIRGHLSVRNNPYLTSLDFLSAVVLVSRSFLSMNDEQY